MGLTPETKDRPAPAGPRRPLLVWCLLRDQRAHVEPVERHFGAEAEFVYDAAWDPDAMLHRRPDLVLCVNDYHYDVARCLDAARASGIPSLVLQDGILEWRCQYENPLFGSGGGAPQHQPVLADKIACLGPQSARQIEAWGNPGKAVATGMPRLDSLLERPRHPRRAPGSRLLVMTAKNPGFTPAQRETTIASLRDVRALLEGRADVTVSWRVPRPLDEALGVASLQRETTSEELAAQIESCDAVVTTPSTAMLEAMLLDRPVAALDYHNVPRFVATAWTISARDQIGSVIAGILNPTPNKLAFQRDCLRDALTADGPAAPRVGDLMRELAGRTARGSGASVSGSGRPSGESLADLYPGQSVFAERDVQTLQLRLARAEKALEQLRREKERRGLSHGLHAMGREVARFLRSRNKGAV